jgi:hypothetical protein
MDLFYAATTIPVGNGRKTPFWHAPCLNGKKPIEIVPVIFTSSERKKWTFGQALRDDAWIGMWSWDEILPWNASHHL